MFNRHALRRAYNIYCQPLAFRCFWHASGWVEIWLTLIKKTIRRYIGMQDDDVYHYYWYYDDLPLKRRKWRRQPKKSKARRILLALKREERKREEKLKTARVTAPRYTMLKALLFHCIAFRGECMGCDRGDLSPPTPS